METDTHMPILPWRIRNGMRARRSMLRMSPLNAHHRSPALITPAFACAHGLMSSITTSPGPRVGGAELDIPQDLLAAARRAAEHRRRRVTAECCASPRGAGRARAALMNINRKSKDGAAAVAR